MKGPGQSWRASSYHGRIQPKHYGKKATQRLFQAFNVGVQSKSFRYTLRGRSHSQSQLSGLSLRKKRCSTFHRAEPGNCKLDSGIDSRHHVPTCDPPGVWVKGG